MELWMSLIFIVTRRHPQICARQSTISIIYAILQSIAKVRKIKQFRRANPFFHCFFSLFFFIVFFFIFPHFFLRSSGEKIRAHRTLLAARCRYFAAMLGGRFSEGSKAEASALHSFLIDFNRLFVRLIRRSSTTDNDGKCERANAASFTFLLVH